MTLVPADADRLTTRDRLQRRDHSDAYDAVRADADAGRLDWSLFPETGGRVRANLQATDARTAFRVLATAAVLLLVQATLVPWAVAGFVAEMPGNQRALYAEYVNPAAATMALALSASLFACAVLAARRPLSASVLALAFFAAASAPFIGLDATLSVAPHLGRVVVLLLLLKALATGLSYRAR